MIEAVLARHGESGTSARRVVGGDEGLTDAGRAQARALGAALAAFPADVCLVSGARRARETARLALAGRDVPFETVRELGDIDFGRFDGRPLDEYRAWIRGHPPGEAVPGGESRVDTLRRFAGALRSLASRPEGYVLVVAHGLLLRAATDERPEAEVAGVPYGSHVRVTRDEVLGAARRLERWCEAPAW